MGGKIIINEKYPDIDRYPSEEETGGITYDPTDEKTKDVARRPTCRGISRGLAALALIAMVGCVSAPLVDEGLQYLNRTTTEQKKYMDGTMEFRMEKYIFQRPAVKQL